MIVCSCNAISDTSVKASVGGEHGARTPGAVYRCLGCRPCCGRCFATVRAIIDEALVEAGARDTAACAADCTACAAKAA